MSENGNSPFSQLAKEAAMQPQEQLMELKKSEKRLYIGIPKEITYQENRVPLTPNSVELLVSNGHEVVIESNAGKNANFTDAQYSECGAKIVYSKQEVYKADVILKVDPPTKEEIDLMKADQLLISALQLGNSTSGYIRHLCSKKICALGYEFLRNEQGSLTIIQTMSEIAGSTSVLIGAEYLSNVSGGKGELLGGITGIPPTEVVIIGSGTVGEYAVRTALGLGANVKVFDRSINRMSRLQNHIGTRIYTSVLTPKVLSRALSSADLAIGALRNDDGRSPTIVTEAMVKLMKPNAVIVDVSIDQGGVFETSEITNHTNPIFRKHDVIHYCVPNIPSRVSRTASYALSNILAPLLLSLSNAASFKDFIWENRGVRQGVYIYKGNLVKKPLAERFQLPHKDLDLLIAAHF